MITNSPRLYFVGPMPGRTPGNLPTMGEYLAQRFKAEGTSVRLVSTQSNRYIRLVDIIWQLLQFRTEYETAIIQVYSGQSFLLCDTASLIAKRTGKRIVLHLHGGMLPSFSQQNPTWVKRVFARADNIIAPSTYLANQLAWLGYRIQVIPNVLDIENYCFTPRTAIRPNLLWMRSFHEIYHPQMAVEVLAKLLPKYPQAVLTMAGPDKGLLVEVKRLAQQMGVESRVCFPGFLDSVGKLRAGLENDLYLNTNRIDNMPVTILEMAAFGVPVVATRVGGIPYLLDDGVNALLTPDDDVQAMAYAVERLLQDPLLTANLSYNGRQLAECCSWKQVGVQWRELLQSPPTN